MKTNKISFFSFTFIALIIGLINNQLMLGQKVPKHDANGNLLPLVSYHEVVLRGMKHILYDSELWYAGDKNLLKDEKGVEQPAYTYFSNLNYDGKPRASAVDKYVSYPAFHHSIFIRTFIKYYEYTGDTLSLQKARNLADWNIAHSTPLEWAYGGMPYSTYYGGKSGGFRDGNSIMPDKAAIMGLAYLRLFKSTGDKKYYNASEKIAMSLAKNQLPEGNWPFRINPQTKEVKEQYTSSVVYAVELFDQLDSLNINNHFQDNRDRAFNWIMQNPVQNFKWSGFYEDIPEDSTNRTNWDCIDFINYLLNNNINISIAERTNQFICKTFIDHPAGYEPAEGIREQLACFHTMGVHSAHWAAMMANCYQATGDEQYRNRSIQTMNYVTYHLEPNNTILVGVNFAAYPQWWYSCHFGVILYLLDFMKSFPEFSPDGETHLLNSTCGVQSISYEPGSISYKTLFQSHEMIKLSFIPQKVKVNGKSIPAKSGMNGWIFNPKNKTMKIVHDGGVVEIH